MNDIDRRILNGQLPTWDNMSDLDKGAALLHDHKRDYEGISYAVENYPARYWDDPRLTALTPTEASAHAAAVCGDDVLDRIGIDEHDRLYDLTLDHERAQRAA